MPDHIQPEAKPRWVKLILWALTLSILVPFVLSFVFPRYLQQLQLAGLLIGVAWFLVCGFFTTFNPLPIARWFARPGTYELMNAPDQPAWSRWYLRCAGVFLMLVALLVGAMFWFTRKSAS